MHRSHIKLYQIAVSIMGSEEGAIAAFIHYMKNNKEDLGSASVTALNTCDLVLVFMCSTSFGALLRMFS